MKAGGFFTSAEDLIQKTPLFWDNYVRQKISREFLGLFRAFNDPYPDGPNPYIERIEANMARLRREIASRNKPCGRAAGGPPAAPSTHVARVCFAALPPGGRFAD
jgi:hypothetical protein